MPGIYRAGFKTAFWFGNQGFTFLDLGRFWQMLLTAGLFFWVVILFRGLSERIAGAEFAGNMPWLFFFAALSIPAFYAVGLLVQTDSTLPQQISGGSGWSICGWRIFSNCSRRSWSPIFSCCSAWCISAWLCG